MLRICIILIFLSLFPVTFANKYRDKQNKETDPKQQYEVDVKRAQDLVQAYQSLKRHVDTDHYVYIKLKDVKKFYSAYGVTHLEAFGSLLNIKIVHIDNEDEWAMFTIPASKVLYLKILKRP